MSGIYIFSENLALAAQLIQLGSTLDKPIYAICHQMEDANTLAAYPVQSVHLLQGSSSRPEDYAEALAVFLKTQDASLLIIGDTISGRELAAKTAAILDAGLVSGAGEIEQGAGGFETSRVQFGGAVIKKEQLDGFAIVTVPAGKYLACAAGDTQAEIFTHQVDVDASVEQVELLPIEREGVALDKSKAVIGVGLGFNQKEDLALAEDLAQSLNGAVGCTRPVADDKKWLPTEQYIGISGANIHPDLYIALGISGQIQHVVGVRDSKILVAINKNEKAPIFAVADYGIVGDLYQIVPKLNEAVKSRSHE